MTDDVRAMAVKLASMGLPVFRIKAGEKTPLEKGFYDKANADPEIVGKRFTDIDGTPINCNVGVLCNSSLPDGRRLHVIDVDTKNGKEGLETLEQLKQRGLNTDTLTVRTPSGGIHLYYGAPADWPELGNSEQKLGPGVDTRGYHGYVVGPGSVVGNKPYELVRNGQIATLEPWMLELLQSRKSFEDKSTWLCEPDLPKNVERATDHAAGYPRAEEGARNAQLFVLAKDMRKFGISHELAKALVLEHWPTAESLSEDEFEKTVRSAYDGPQMEPAGINTADAQFDDIHESVDETATQSPTQLAKARFTFETIDDVLTAPDITWLVNGWIPEGQPGMFYGPSGSYKSFVALDLGLHLAHGEESWHGTALPGVPCDVLVIASEGRAGHKKRILAFNKHHGISHNPTTLRFLRGDVNFMRDSDFKGLCDAIKELGIQFRLIIIDTVQRVTAGVDSNTQEAVGLFMERCRKLGAVAGNAATLAVHHTNKTGTLLGSGVFRNESDFLFKVERSQAGIALHCEKLKDDEDNWQVNASIEELRFGPNQHDKSMILTGMGQRSETSPSQPDPPRASRRAPPGFDAQAQKFFDAVRGAWDAGMPFNDSHQAIPLKRNMLTRAMNIMGVSRGKAKELLDIWKDAGHLKVDILDPHSKMKGYRVENTPWDCGDSAETAAEIAEMFS